MAAIQLRLVRADGPYEAYVLPVSGYPMPQAELERTRNFLQAFCAAASKRWNLFSEVFMQLEQLDAEGCRESFSANARAWLPQAGLGVWVDREPPQKWTPAELANLVPGDKLRPIMFQVFRVSEDQRQRIDARCIMLQFGPVMEILTPQEEGYPESSSPIFKEGIVDPSFTCFPYYAGLMEAKTIATATIDQLDRWFDGMTVYIRQSFEDKGILIASAENLGPVFESIGGQRIEGGWTLPAG